MPYPVAPIFDTELLEVSEPEPRIVGPWRRPVQMLAEQSVGGHTSIHDDETAQKVGFRAGAIEGPTHFSQLVPLGYHCFGDAFLARGCISSHFRQPCVEGDEVQAWASAPAGDARLVHAGMTKRDGSAVLSATLSVGPEHPVTELDALMAGLRPPERLVILRDLAVGRRGAVVEKVSMGFEQNMGALYPFTLAAKLRAITEPCRYYTSEGAADSPWGRPLVPFEMISVLTQYTSLQARFPVRQPSVGLFVNQEIRLLDGPIFVDEVYHLEREVVRLSESRKVESMWILTSVTEAKSGRLIASVLLNSAVLKASYPEYERELAGME